MAGYTADAVRLEMRRRGEQITALTVERLRQLGIESEVAIMRGDPQWIIPYEARKWSADLVFIRAHNLIDFRSWMLGSVAKAVVRDAPCSVEVVRAVKEDLKVVGNGHMKILLATDGSEQSAAADPNCTAPGSGAAFSRSSSVRSMPPTRSPFN